MLSKQAKILSDTQIEAVIAQIELTRHSKRNLVMFLLSLHGLRAKEIASLEVSMVTDADGLISDRIALEDKASKGRSGRMVFMNLALREALVEYLSSNTRRSSKFLISTERADRFSANAVAVFFKRLYENTGLQGCSSHSGRRTMITRAARKIFKAGGSLKDVQALAGHRHLSTTQRYIEQDVDAQRIAMGSLY